jgi:formylglycine-generating enzyme required for sulfatase activity
MTPTDRITPRPPRSTRFTVPPRGFERLYGANPSYNVPGKVFESVRTTPLHPVETVSWERFDRLLPRFGMTFPTEAQWEVGALGGGQHVFVWGPTPWDLAGCANTSTSDLTPQIDPPIADDGFYGHAPVGSFRANGYGLHDVIGNVSEYCMDPHARDYHEREHRAGDGLVDVDAPRVLVVRRGGSFPLPTTHAFVYLREERLVHAGDGVTGVRPTWPLTQARGAR